MPAGTIAMSQQVLAQAPQQPQPQPQPQQQSQQQPLAAAAATRCNRSSGGSLNLIGASSNGNNGRNIVPPGQKWGDAADSDETVAWAAGNIVRGQPGVHNLRPVMMSYILMNRLLFPDPDEKMRHLLDHISPQTLHLRMFGWCPSARSIDPIFINRKDRDYVEEHECTLTRSCLECYWYH